MTFEELRRGIEILAQYQKDKTEDYVVAHHEQLFCCSTDLPLSYEHELQALGWFESQDSWSHFT